MCTVFYFFQRCRRRGCCCIVHGVVCIMELMHTLCKLSDDAKLLCGLKGVEHLDDVFMLELAQDLNLLAQVADVLFALAMLHDKLERHDLATALATALVHLRGRQQQVKMVGAG